MSLGTCMLILPLYHPFHVAEQVVLLDAASGGRAILGVAPGWRKPTIYQQTIIVGGHARLSAVMPGLVPGIHALKDKQNPKTWMAGTSPAMTSSRDGAVSLPQHEAVEERGKLRVPIERENVRDVLVRPHHHHTSGFALDAA
jgi:Luciferase-like monooxygenase